MAVTLRNFIPVGNYVSPAYIISFDITSDGDSIDTSTLGVQLIESGHTSITAGVFQGAFYGTIGAVVSAGEDGYSVLINTSRNYFGQTITVQITGDTNPTSGGFIINATSFSTTNLLGVMAPTSLPLVSSIVSDTNNFSGLSFSNIDNNIVLYQLNDASEPVITNRIPVSNSTGNERNTNISFSVHDRNQEGVLITTLDAWVNEVQMISGGAFVPPATGLITPGIVDGFDGWQVLINNPGLFFFSAVIPVRVVIDDAVVDPTARNTLDITYLFTIKPYVDIYAPGATLTLPPAGLPLDGCIEFDWLDAEFGEFPNLFTLNVTLRREITSECITIVRDDVAVINGVATPGYNLFIEAIEIGFQKGYHIIICTVIPFNELESIEVIINGEDSLGNSGTSSFSISTVELTPPEITNIFPAPGAINVASNASIIFDMHDYAGTGVIADSVSVSVDNVKSVINGIAQSGFDFSYQAGIIIEPSGLQFDGYHFEVTRLKPFTPGKNILVEIDGYDGYNNLATTEFDFTIAPDTTPPSITIYPNQGEIGVDLDSYVAVEVRDYLGVNQSSINISIRGAPAVTNGQGVSPFDVHITETEYLPGSPDGYSFIIYPAYNFGFNQKVIIVVSGKDIYGNNASKTSSFTTFSDTTPPSIVSIFPQNGQEDVSLNTDIGFTVLDEYDINYEQLSVFVNGELAIHSGVTQGLRYDAVINRIVDASLNGGSADGYQVTISPKFNFNYNSEIAVKIAVSDRSQGNITYSQVIWYTIRPRPPLYEMIPTPNQENVDIDTNILFEVFDDGYDININTLNVSINGLVVVSNGVIQTPDFVGTINSVDPLHHYAGNINPRFLLKPDSIHTISISAREIVSGNFSQSSYLFYTGSGPDNPKTVYVGGSNGVQSIVVDDITGSSVSSEIIDGYYVYDIHAKVLNYTNKLAIGTQGSGAVLLTTNYPASILVYSSGDDINRARLTTNNSGTLYLANNTKERIDVYYNILYDDAGRDIPDAYYSELDDGYFTDMTVSEGTSIVNSGSNSVFLGTPSGVYRIETDESNPGVSESNGQIISYGVYGSENDYKILDGQTNYVVAVDVNTRLNHLYVATRDNSQEIAVTYIDLGTNSFDGSITEDRLIYRLINDISFEDPE